jgi:signal transduction histidine kinase
LKTPLNGVLGAVEVMNSSLTKLITEKSSSQLNLTGSSFDLQELQTYVSLGKSCCFNLRCIIGDFVDYATLQGENDDLQLNSRLIDLYELIEEIE